MPDALFYLAVATLAIYTGIGIDLMRGNRTVRFLREVPPALPAPVPRVSIIVAARNEELHLREALQSLLRLEYPDYELIAVDDRSDDATGTILEELAATDSRLQIVRIDVLPSGWLGKTHAHWAGSRRATGEVLLFTDADIVMEPSVLARAVSFLMKNGLDHLAVTPTMTMPSLFLAMFGASFILFFSLFARPWKARDPDSPRHIGIGAFNLVRSDAYRQVGGHEAIRMRPDDDLKLGKIIKKKGFRQDVAYGEGLLSVEWYASVRDLIRGLEKNAFSGTDYRVLFALWGVLFYLACGTWPYLALLITGGATRAANAAIVVLITVIFADTVRFHGARWWYAAGFPLTAALFSWIILRTVVLNLVQGGITWRGTFYPLSELTRNRV